MRGGRLQLHGMNGGKPVRSGQAFTLVEMLVVITIIGILAALLLPSLMSALDSAKTMSCLNNQKQLAYGFGMYSGDNGEKILRQWRNSGSSGVAYWPPFLSGQQLQQSGYPSALANGPKYVEKGSAFLCPATPGFGGFGKKGGNGGWESEYSGYGMYQPSNETYAEKPSILDNWYPNGSGAYPMIYTFKLPRVVRASRLVLLADTITASTGSRTNAPSTQFVPSYDVSYTPRIHLLHGSSSANVLFFDSHAQTLDPARINQTLARPKYYWFKNNAQGIVF